MTNVARDIESSFLKQNLPEFQPGDTVRVYQRIPAPSGANKKEGEKERIQPFEGLVIARKHGQGINATFTLRAMVEGVGVERVFPLHSPLIDKIEVIDKRRARRAKLYYIRSKAESEIRRKLKPRK